ncbi:hypothetical protein GCM10009430_14500 [Aquimarina litoralis]|uniref:Xylose isomerase-like TIM barrel domain-containing protein n=1 Tax=Aquimarina litoralis TaxID=584605 RepID=A0ABN1IMK6_9FLAO
MNIRSFSILICLVIQWAVAQDNMKTINHKYLLQQYAGEWINGDMFTSKKPSKNPNIKIVVTPKLKGLSYNVEVFKKENDQWFLLLSEIISYDQDTNQIVALGSNSEGKNFVGRGGFLSYKKLIMKDHDFKGNFVQEVSFSFEDDGRLLLKGDAPGTKDDWEGVYFKKKNRNKKFGIHLVSVDEEMRNDPIRTLEKIGQMGYSYVETHRYKDRKFYGFTPEEFKVLLAKNGLTLGGSMVFKDPDINNMDQTMKWWDECIKDQLAAGVEYITTTNININIIKKASGLEQYANYFNAIGKKCRENEILFLYHNHTEEFQKIKNQRIYDYLLENTDPELVYFQSDLYWMYKADVNPVAYFKKFLGRFLSWHVKDIKELGASGKIDFEHIFSYAKVAGLRYNTVEVEDYDYPTLVSAKMAADYMRNSNFVKANY